MKVDVIVNGPDESPVDIKTIDKGTGFQLTKGPDQPIYIMDSSDDTYYYAINTKKLSVATIRVRTMVYPVQIKSVKMEIELV